MYRVTKIKEEITNFFVLERNFFLEQLRNFLNSLVRSNNVYISTYRFLMRTSIHILSLIKVFKAKPFCGFSNNVY